MKFAMSAAATLLVASFFVLEAPAQETIKSTGTVVTTSDYRTVQPARTGLFSRLRNRNNSNISTASMTSTTPMTVAPATITTTPATTTPSTTTPATTTTTVPMASATQIVEPRQGLFARLRARR